MRALRLGIRSQSGQDLIEYALLASLISIMLILSLRLVGVSMLTRFDEVKGSMSEASRPAGISYSD